MAHPVVEIYGANTVNKGAELMLLAAREALADRFRLAVAPNVATRAERERYGLYSLLEHPREKVNLATRWLPPVALGSPVHATTSRRINGVVDASGFSLSDQFPPERAEGMARRVARWRAQGRRIVLLPQAFGPFRDERVRISVRNIVQHADLVFVRDDRSAELLTDAGISSGYRRAPDFTLSVASTPVDYGLPASFAAIVPNSKMLTSTDERVSSSYVPLLAAVARKVSDRGLRPLLIQHERTDGELVARVGSELPWPVDVVAEEDPRRLKYVLGRAELVVGSRFHALVGALSQGVPAVALGWSHKYPELFREFGVDHFAAAEYGHAGVLSLVDEALQNRASIHDGLVVAAGHIADESAAMWTDVHAVLSGRGAAG